MILLFICLLFFFFNDTATTEIYTLSLHDALPIYRVPTGGRHRVLRHARHGARSAPCPLPRTRSEEHTSELQSQSNLVCRLLLEKKKNHARRLRQHHDTCTITRPCHGPSPTT